MSVAITSAGVAIGTIAAVEPFSRNGASSVCDAAERTRRVGVEHDRLAALEEAADRVDAERLRAEEDRAHRGREPLVRDVERERTAAARGAGRACRRTAASTSSSSTIVRATASSVTSSERLSANDLRDLVERAELPRSGSLRRERGLELGAEPRRALVQPRVLHRDGELAGERGEQLRLVRGERAPRVG